MQVDFEIVLEQMEPAEIEVEMEAEIEMGVVELRGMHFVDLVLVVEQFQVPEVDGGILLSFRLVSYRD